MALALIVYLLTATVVPVNVHEPLILKFSGLILDALPSRRVGRLKHSLSTGSFRINVDPKSFR